MLMHLVYIFKENKLKKFLLSGLHFIVVAALLLKQRIEKGST